MTAIGVLGVVVFLILGGAAWWDARRGIEFQACWIPEPHPWHEGCWQARPAPSEEAP